MICRWARCVSGPALCDLYDRARKGLFGMLIVNYK